MFEPVLEQVKTKNYIYEKEQMAIEELRFFYFYSKRNQPSGERSFFTRLAPVELGSLSVEHPLHHWAKVFLCDCRPDIARKLELMDTLQQTGMIGMANEDDAGETEFRAIAEAWLAANPNLEEATLTYEFNPSDEHGYFQIGTQDSLATRYEWESFVTLLKELDTLYHRGKLSLSDDFYDCLTKWFDLPTPQLIEELAMVEDLAFHEVFLLIDLYNGTPFHLAMQRCFDDSED